MSLGKIMSKIISVLPKTEGAAGRITLGRTQLMELAKKDQKAAQLIQKGLSGTKNPKLDIAYKAESNYAIAGMRLRDGKQVLGQGAVSITNPGSSQAVIKYRATGNGGKTLQLSGFADCGKIADSKDIAVSMSRRGGQVKSDLEIGEAAAHHISVNEQDVVDLAKQIGGKDADTFLKLYATGTNRLQQSLDRAMTELRTALKGEHKDYIKATKFEQDAEQIKKFKFSDKKLLFKDHLNLKLKKSNESKDFKVSTDEFKKYYDSKKSFSKKDIDDFTNKYKF